MEAVHAAPDLADFNILSEHQEQTPSSFFGGKPVLHLSARAATLKVSSDVFAARPELNQLTRGNATAPRDGQVFIENVDVWVTSRHMILYSVPHSYGIRIEYPSITVTAQDGSDVLLELNLSDDDTADEDIEFLQLRITPDTVERHAAHQATAGASTGSNGSNGTTNDNDASTALYKAISDCQELNPDPPMQGEEGEDGHEAFDETAPGATGWITSENMADFMDENGNFRMPAGMTVVGGEQEEEAGNTPAEGTQVALGEGAGRTRTAAEALEEEESKWQRTG